MPMIRSVLSLLCLLILLSAAACGGAPAATATPAAAPPTAAHRPTASPQATLTPRPAATATPRPTATAGAAEVACDFDRLRAAAGNVLSLDSYSWATILNMQAPGEDSRQQVLAQRTTVQLSDGQVTAMAMTSISDDPLVDLIFVDDQIYYRMSHGPWQQASAAIAATLGDSLRQTWTIQPDTLDVLVAADCAPLSEVRDGRDAVGYRFMDVGFAALAALTQTGLGDLSPDDLRSVEYTIWLGEADGLELPVNEQIDAAFVSESGEASIQIKTGLSDVNEPVLIEAPVTGVANTFALPLPLPEDAGVYVETETELAFFTATEEADIKAQYVALLLADGWTQGETHEETVDGSTGEVNTFSRDGARLNLNLARRDPLTTVVLILNP